MTWAMVAVLAVPLGAVALSLAGGWRLARAATVASGLVSFGLSISLALQVDRGRTLHAFGSPWLRLDSLGAVF
ncbi:MAG: hypothetical protein ACRDMJ_02700, partial [Solirubrobacteraceae bacterium]